MNIRFANEDDVCALSALSIEVWLHTYASSGVKKSYASYVLSEFAPERLLEHLLDNNQRILKCERDGSLVGYLRAHLDTQCPSDLAVTCEVTTLYVQEHHWNARVESRLLEGLKEELIESDKNAFWLSVNANNMRAIGFYMFHGLENSGELFFELDGRQHKNIIMKKHI